jgi:uncharacterized membrane protein (UPF0127 family)
MKNKNIVLAEDIQLAEGVFSRLKGLMFEKKIKGDGILLRPCNSIHTFFMNFNIDVIFLSKNYKIIKILRNMPPWRMSKMYLKAYQVLELEGGSLDQGICEGDILEEVC